MMLEYGWFEISLHACIHSLADAGATTQIQYMSSMASLNLGTN